MSHNTATVAFNWQLLLPHPAVGVAEVAVRRSQISQ